MYHWVIQDIFILLICFNGIIAQSTTDHNEKYNYNTIYDDSICQYGILQDIISHHEIVHKSDLTAQNLLIENLELKLTKIINEIKQNYQCEQLRYLIANQENVFKNESTEQRLLIEKLGKDLNETTKNVDRNAEQLQNSIAYQGDVLRNESTAQQIMIDKLAKDLNETVNTMGKHTDKYASQMVDLNTVIMKQNDVIESLQLLINEQAAEIKQIKDVQNKTINLIRYKDCAGYYKRGYVSSGVYTIYIPMLHKSIAVYCDMITNGGGWTVFQHREKGDVNFTQTWASYKAGFGNISGDHWLGNDILAAMTADVAAGYKLRVELMKFSLQAGYAEYANFKVGKESDDYRLTVGTYNGTAGDNGKGLSDNNNLRFTTIDKDNDGHSENCARLDEYYGGGWWYTSACGYTNLNGSYTNVRKRSRGDDIFWQAFDGFYSLKQTEMKFRPMEF